MGYFIAYQGKQRSQGLTTLFCIFQNGGYSSDEKQEESLEEAKARMHQLLDDAFSLFSHSRSSMRWERCPRSRVRLFGLVQESSVPPVARQAAMQVQS